MRVLVLDDDEFMLEFMTHLLRELGVSEVLVAKDGRAGLFVLAAQVTEIDLLICEIEMPGMDGIEFLRNIAEQSYRGKIVLFSGVNEDLLKAAERLGLMLELNIIGALTKPVTMGAVAAVLQQLSSPLPRVLDTDKIQQLFDVEEIRKALADDQVEIYFQPKISTLTGHITGVECLACLRHAYYGHLTPDSFIPVIECSDLINDFTRCVLMKSANQLSLWLNQALDLRISVNVSMGSLDRFNLPEIYEEAVSAYNVPIERITLEITESELGKDFAQTLDILTRLRSMGFGLAIDGFGTGYASMETLKHMPFTEMKIDRAFAHGATNDAVTRAILESSIKLGRTLNLNVVVEGIETERDYRLAVELGCDEIQGFFVAAPMPAGDFVKWLIAYESTNDHR